MYFGVYFGNQRVLYAARGAGDRNSRMTTEFKKNKMLSCNCEHFENNSPRKKAACIDFV